MPPRRIKPSVIPASTPNARSLLYREEWLTEVAKAVVQPLFSASTTLKPYKVTCGWPCRRGLATKQRVVGECHHIPGEKDGNCEIFISPLLANPLEVAGVLTHEVTHVAAGHLAKHGPKFVKLCKYVGLTKNKPTSAMPGELLEEKLQKELERFGPYPHAAIILTIQPKKPSSQVRLDCPTCGCNLRMTTSWLERSGHPVCGCGGLMEVHEDDE